MTIQMQEEMQLFFDSIRSVETRENYMIYLKKYMELQGLNENDLLREKDPRLIEKEIIDFINKMKKKGKTFTGIKNYTTAVFSFYKINDILLNTNKISKFMPENKRVKKDRGYTHEEIAKLLQIADERSRAVILLLASTGMRVGAIPSLKIGNLEDNKITVYENAREEYFSFITPECKKAVDAYIDFRSRFGEKITDDSPLIREQFDTRDSLAITKAKTIGTVAVQWVIRDLSRRYNVLSKEVPSAHGFRKFWTTQAVKSKMNPEIREMLLGHKIGLASAYYKPTDEEMYQEYEKAIDNLTIDSSQRLERKLQSVQVESSQVVKLALEIEKIKDYMRRHDDDEERNEELYKLVADDDKTRREIMKEFKLTKSKRQIKKR